MQRLVVRVEGAEGSDGASREHDAASVRVARSAGRKEESDDLREIGMFLFGNLNPFFFFKVWWKGFNAQDIGFVFDVFTFIGVDYDSLMLIGIFVLNWDLE